MFKKILIANRGEIACRIMRTAKQWGIQCVAVYSDEDASALHVHMADEAYALGSDSGHLSYLNQPRLLDIAKITHCEAIHPGYGFLSENADFAEACENQGFVFIGAPSQAIRLMGSKSAAKQLMSQAKVPLLPGYHGADQSPARLLQEAEHIGFPVLIKASAGGGGKGMRLTENPEEFLTLLASCQREALNAFGDDTVLLEKYLRSPRHIEVQIFADQHGHCVHLFERDCSIQRRHQKVVEEAPAPHLSSDVRAAMGQAAIHAAQSVQYVGAGTIEFLYDQGAFYFMEMNTRLQVEHPVTEMISGQDLVAWQLLVAYGQALPCQQDQLTCDGHAIEVRIYAEEPEQGFLPATGTLQVLSLPATSAQVRLDTGFQAGDAISIYYDPMLAKLICWAKTRELACQTMSQALDQYAIIGVKTNLSFLAKLMNLPAYRQALVDTGFIQQHAEALLTPNTSLPLACVLFICAQELDALNQATQADPWQNKSGWQNALPISHQWQYQWQSETFDIVARADQKDWHIRINQNHSFVLHDWYILGDECHIRFSLDETGSCQQKARMIQHQQQWHLCYQSQRFTCQRLPRFCPTPTEASHENHLRAPMPGRIIAQPCAIGQEMEAGQALLIMEAMKMEHTIKAPHKGTLQAYLCAIGDVVNEGDLLVDLV